MSIVGTFKTDGDLGTGENSIDPLDVETQRLVLEAGPGGWVALQRKQYGARSQLWRMTGEGQLQHEGLWGSVKYISKRYITVLIFIITYPSTVFLFK